MKHSIVTNHKPQVIFRGLAESLFPRYTTLGLGSEEVVDGARVIGIVLSSMTINHSDAMLFHDRASLVLLDNPNILVNLLGFWVAPSVDSEINFDASGSLLRAISQGRSSSIRGFVALL